MIQKPKAKNQKKKSRVNFNKGLKEIEKDVTRGQAGRTKSPDNYVYKGHMASGLRARLMAW